ncbi:hypothetical protein Nepgr_019063 [Nepenthes gracilis]|uniref:C2H2-type domain-containing protein n=1 Tax=Nepenthes gracilis TaxID=150966 RepID=A0AAD3SV75_NEPGR|nr:hypothetical protein Nepgr_019063 [Nepenthes gracilis]
MALIIDQQSDFRYFCKICRKGFSCGRALGGHMRAHGRGDWSENADDDDDEGSDWDERLGGGDSKTPPSNKRMYALRRNPNRQRSCRFCRSCGMEFSSWKTFLEHGKCSTDECGMPGRTTFDGGGGGGCGWSNRNRSIEVNVGNYDSNCPSSEEEDVANCLIMLSNSTVNPRVKASDQPEKLYDSPSRNVERRNLINFIGLLASRVPLEKGKGIKGMFECKACKRVFNSYQALGGHRASHRKVKGCFEARLSPMEESSGDDRDSLIRSPSRTTSTPPFDRVMSKSRSKVHECSVCHRIFSSGQALGGHKRCHWITSNPPHTPTLARFQQLHDHVEQVLDLNLPAPNDETPGPRKQPRNQLSVNVSTEFFLQPWGGGGAEGGEEFHKSLPDNHRDKDGVDDSSNVDHHHQKRNIDGEANSKVKLAKLSELKDINMAGSSSSWLQVGIGSSNGGGAGP